MIHYLQYFNKKILILWSRQIRVTSQDKQASMHTPRFCTQSKQSSTQPVCEG